MRLIHNIRKILVDFRYVEIFQAIAIYFALLYHVAFFITFGILKIYPLFFFNIYSVTLFSVIAIMNHRGHSFSRLFVLFYIEVVVHQLLADYYLGGMASFHFFIFLTGIVPLLAFRNHFKQAAFYGIISIILFSVLEVIAPYITPQYQLSKTALLVIKSVNISMNSIVNISGLLMYSYLVHFVEDRLQDKVREKTDEVQRKSEKLLKIQGYVINSLANLVDNRDVDTGDHIQRTSAYVELISKAAMEKGLFTDEINPEFIEYMKRAAPLHDVGKIIVPDAILKKPGKLTPEEYEEMKMHAKEGGRIIREVFALSDDKEFIRIAAEVASCHHEWWNGLGYPNGLKGEEIPLSARIMAVADVFDALVSKRCYKQPYSVEDAYMIIKDETNTHFDPVLAELFMEQKEEIAEVMKRFRR